MSAGLGGLGGTLNGMAVLSQMEALRRQQEEELARRAQEATAQAQAAQQAFGQVAAAPPPQLDPLAVFLPTLIGNVASVIAQDPGYRQRAQQGIQQQREDQFRARAQNLQALRDNALQLAERAQRVGDLELEAKHRGKFETLSKALDMLEQKERITASEKAREDELKGRKELQGQEHKNTLAEIAAREAAQRKTLQTAGKGAAASDFEKMLQGLPTLSQFNDDKRVLVGQLAPKVASKIGFEGTVNNIQQLRGIARQRLRSDRTPGVMIGRLRAFNREVSGFDYRKKAGGLFGRGKQTPDIKLTEAEIAQAVRDAFSPAEIEAWRQKR